MPTENIYITGQNVTASSDANIILSLGGTPSGAALEPFSINASWNGQLPPARGGTGLNGIGTSLQLLRTNAAATALEYFTPSTSDIAEGSNLYFTESRVRNTTLTGLNITGTSITSADSILTAFGKVQNQINSLIGGVNYQGTWNATTNSPALASGVGTKGYYYVVSVPGSTNLDGITDWKLGDWAIFNGATWGKVDNTDAVVSVNGYTGTVVLAKADLGLGNVENTALSTWAGTTNITTVGTITSGTWNASILGKAYGGTGVNISTTALTLGTASANNGSIVFQNSANANTLTINSGATSTSYSLTLPLAQGGASTYLRNDGTGVLSWAAASSGITVGTTTITSGTSGRLGYNLAGVYQESISYSITPTDASPYNVILGFASGTAASGGSFTGTKNTFIGHTAGKSNTSASNNVYIGWAAGLLQTTGAENVVVGANALAFHSTGAGNVVLGFEAMGYTGAGYGSSNNVVLGWKACRGGTAFGYATVIGNQAGLYNAVGNYSVVIGYNANGSASPYTNSIAIGANAANTANNQMVVGAAAAAGGTGVVDNVYFNGVTFTDPAIITLRNCGKSGSNQTSTAYFRIIPSLGTGTGVGSYFTIWTGDAGSTGSTLNTPTEKMRLVQGGDLVLGITSDAKGLVLKSSDGHYWRVTISTLGVLTTADLGTSIPT